MWPVLFSNEFKEQNPIRPKGAANEDNLKALIMSSLRYGLANYKSDSKIRPPEQLTYYKPFNIKELEFDVWDTFDERKDKARHGYGV